MRARLAPGDLVIDAGAHTRYFTVLASRLVGPAGHVVTIEPSPVFHQALTANLTANDCHNLPTVNAAVSDTPGQTTLYLESATNLDGTTAVRPRTVEASFEADTAPLLSLLPEDELAAPA